MRTAKSPRANRLVSLRDLVVLGVTNGIADRRSLVDLAVEHGVFLTERSKTAYSYSSVYRNLDSLRFLNLEIAGTFDEPMVWSEAAQALAGAAVETKFTTQLTEAEKAIFREQMFVSGVAERFLSLFCSSGRTPRDREEFLRDGTPLYVLGTVKILQSGPAPSSRHREKEIVKISPDPGSGHSLERSAQEFLYTYRLWCLDCQLTEELNIAEAERCGVPRNQSHVLFPVRADVPPSLVEFIDALYNSVGNPSAAVTVPIPSLFYRLCPSMRMTVDAFKELLMRAWAEHRDLFHLERGPAALIKGDLPSDAASYDKRYGNHRYYVTLNHTVRTNMTLFPKGGQR